MSTKKIIYLGENNSGKTEALISFFLNALENGVSSSEILFFVRNKSQEHLLRQRIYSETDFPLYQLNIFRYRAFVYRTVNMYWGFLFKEKPEFMGFSETINLLRYFISIKPDFFKDVYYGNSFFIKIYERLQRAADNHLNNQELDLKTINIEKNDFNLQVNKVISEFNNWCIERDKPLLDYSLQLKVFWKLLDIEEIKQAVFSQYPYAWLIDDLDDTIASEQLFFEKAWDFIQNFVYTANPYGGFRNNMGSNPEYLKNLLKKTDKIINLETKNHGSFHKLGNSVYDTLTSSEININLENLEKFKEIYSDFAPNYGIMLKKLELILLNLKEDGYKPDDITIICINNNEQLHLEISYQLEKINWSLDTIKNSQVIIRNPVVAAIITLLRIIFHEEIVEYGKISTLSSFDFSQLLYTVGNLDNYYLSKLRILLKDDPKNWYKFIRDYSSKEGFVTLKTLEEVLTHCRKWKKEILDQKEYTKMIKYIWKELFWTSESFQKKSVFNEVRIFFDMFKNHLNMSKYIKSEAYSIPYFIQCLLSGELSDNPDKILNINLNTVKLLSLQKLVEIKYHSRIHIWLDISSNEWMNPRHHPLINPIILSGSWPENKEWTIIEEENFLEESLARKLKMAFSLCTEKSYFLASDYNIMGESQNFDFLKTFIINSKF